MRILITNNTLGDLAGTETWVITMCRELSKKHEVGVYSQHKGYVASLLREYIDDSPRGYDLALINHSNNAHVDAKFKIFTSHGVVPALETPPKGMDYYVAVNENVAARHDIKHIIKNPIDTELFRPMSPIRNRPDRVLSLTTQPIPIAHRTGSRREYSTPDIMNDVDVVVSLGRGALEAMSCGRCVITWDVKSGWGGVGDGYLDDLTRLTGYVAGPYLKRSLDWGEELAKYDPEHGERNREYILKHHDVRNIAKEYIKIWKMNTSNDT